MKDTPPDCESRTYSPSRSAITSSFSRGFLCCAFSQESLSIVCTIFLNPIVERYHGTREDTRGIIRDNYSYFLLFRVKFRYVPIKAALMQCDDWLERDA